MRYSPASLLPYVEIFHDIETLSIYLFLLETYDCTIYESCWCKVWTQSNSEF